MPTNLIAFVASILAMLASGGMSAENPQSCLLARAKFQEQEAAYRKCETDKDCALAETVVRCFGPCPPTYLAIGNKLATQYKAFAMSSEVQELCRKSGCRTQLGPSEGACFPDHHFKHRAACSSEKLCVAVREPD